MNRVRAAIRVPPPPTDAILTGWDKSEKLHRRFRSRRKRTARAMQQYMYINVVRLTKFSIFFFFNRLTPTTMVVYFLTATIGEKNIGTRANRVPTGILH